MSVNKLFKSRSVIIEMLKMRGFNVEPYENFSMNEIEAMFKATEKKTTVTELISENAPNLRTVILVRFSELGSARTELPEQSELDSGQSMQW